MARPCIETQTVTQLPKWFSLWRGADLLDPLGLLEGGEQLKHAKISPLEKAAATS